MKRLVTIFAVVLFIAGSSIAAGTADIMLVVDESGSMGGEHAWIAGMITDLETALNNAGVTGNQYALVGFGAANPNPHKISVGGGDWGTAAELSTAAGTLVTTGTVEDGWDAMDFGLNSYTWRSDVARNIILITDEDRDNWNSNSHTYDTILSQLLNPETILNAVVDCQFVDDYEVEALGVDSDKNAYIEASGGTFTTSSGGKATTDFGSTLQDYVWLAWDASGAAWDINKLRDGGDTAESFTNAFIEIKVSEINGVIPAPGAILLGSIGVSIVGWLRRRRTL